MTMTIRALLVAVGALIAVAGIVWTLQGLDYVTGSFMTGATVWAIIGPITAVIGLALAAAGLLKRRIPGGREGN
jgi:hypothetical protein